MLVDCDFVGYRLEGNKLHELPPSAICQRRAEIGMVFQQFNLFPHMTVLENLVEAPVRVKREPVGLATAKANDLVQRVGLSEKRGAGDGDESQGLAFRRADVLARS